MKKGPPRCWKIFSRNACGKGTVHVTDLDRDEAGEIVRRIAVGARCARREALRAVGDRRQRLVIDRHEGGCIFCEIPAFRNDDRHQLADEARFVFGKAVGHQRLLDRRARHQERNRLALHRFG